MVDFTDNFSQYAISKLPTFRDDFLSYANVTEGDLAWASTDTSRIRVNPTNDDLDFNFNIASTNVGIGHDLGVGNVSNERWVLHAKVNFTTLSADTNTRMYFGLSDSNQATAINASADRIYMLLRFSTGIKDYASLDTDGAGEGAQDTNITFTFLTGVDYYLTVQRDSFQSYHVEIFTDKARTISLGRADGVCVPTTQDLRYIVIQNVNATLNTTMTGTIDDIEFWGVPRTFQDDFSTPVNWIQTNTGVSITGGVISGWGAGGVDRRVTHDLGTPLSDTQFKAEFEYRFTASSIPSHGVLTFHDIDQDIDATSDNDALSVIHGTSVDTLKILHVDNGDLGADGVSSSGIPVSTSTTYFVRFERLSSTETKLSVFSDSGFTTHIASSPVTLTVPSTIDALQFVSSQTFSQAGGGRTLTGTLDNLVITGSIGENILEGAQQGDETFQDNFSFDKGWTLTGVGVAITGGILDYPYQGDGTTQGASFDLGAGNVSDDNWAMRFKLVIADISGTPASDAISVAYGIADIQTESSNTSVDGLHFGINKSSATGDKFILFNTNSALPIDGSETNKTEFTTTPVAGTFYVELKRESATLGRATIYSDADYTDVIETQTVTTSTAVTALRFINYTGRVLSRTGVIETEIDNIEFYNGVSVSLTPVKPADEDFEDSFVEDNWTQAGTAIAVNTTTQLVDCDWKRTTTSANAETFDLETVLADLVNPNRWGLRFKCEILTATAGATASQMAVWLTELASGSTSEVAQDHVTFRIQLSSNGDRVVSIFADDNTQIFTGDSASLGTNIVSAGDIFYCELTRDGTLYSGAIYSDPDFTQVISKEAFVDSGGSTISTLRYLKIGKRDTTTTTGSYTGTIDKIQFWNGNIPTDHGTKWVEVNII